jgi:hypothetical protein
VNKIVNMKKFILIILLFIPMSYGYSEEYTRSRGFLSNQMADWCTGDAGHQDFCHGFLLGIYENSSCVSQETPDFTELKRVFVGWVYSRGKEAYVFASESAAEAFYEKYGCKSFLQSYLTKNK